MRDLDRRAVAGVCGLLALATLVTLPAAGPLNPPAGAVTSTNKTLAEIEPRIAVNATNTPGSPTSYEYVLAFPGSYYLTGPLTSSKPYTILIGAGNYTLDLNGFTVSNTNTTTTATAIFFSVGTTPGSLTIRNGAISSVARGYASNSGPANLVIDSVNISAGAAGISSFNPSIVTHCTITQTGTSTSFDGITCDWRSIVRDCTVLMNPALTTPASNNGIIVARDSIVDSCIVDSGGIGIYSTDGIVRNCRVQNQNNTGIRMNTGGICENNSVAGAPVGITCSGAEVRGNRVNGTNAASAVGIYITGPNNTIAKNTVTNFSGAGSYAIATSSSTNQSGNKIMDNELINNYRHINITAPYNFIVRNSMSFTGAGGATSFAAGNSYGPVINAGNTDLSTVPGSSHPQANIAY